MTNVQLWLTNGQTIQMRVDDADAELAALKARTGRYGGEFVSLPGPVIGVVKTDEIVAVIVR